MTLKAPQKVSSSLVLAAISAYAEGRYKRKDAITPTTPIYEDFDDVVSVVFEAETRFGWEVDDDVFEKKFDVISGQCWRKRTFGELATAISESVTSNPAKE